MSLNKLTHKPDERIIVTPDVSEEMVRFFWEWRARNHDEVLYYDGQPDVKSLYDGLRNIQVVRAIRFRDSG